MARMSLAELTKKMRALDFCMLLTKAAGGEIAGRPMSNNGEVDAQGQSWFFTLEDTHTVAEIERDPRVTMTFAGTNGIIGHRPLFIAVEGQAELIRDDTAFERHWTKDLDGWFEHGIDTPGLVLLKVRASRLHYWDGHDDGEFDF